MITEYIQVRAAQMINKERLSGGVRTKSCLQTSLITNVHDIHATPSDVSVINVKLRAIQIAARYSNETSSALLRYNPLDNHEHACRHQFANRW
jgi:hypothetical protein